MEPYQWRSAPSSGVDKNARVWRQPKPGLNEACRGEPRRAKIADLCAALLTRPAG